MKILVRGTNWIGDAVMTIPALRRLRSSFPDARIALHTRSWAEGIFRNADFIDEIIPFDSAKSKTRTVFDQAVLLKKRSSDLAILLPNSFESALIARLASIPRRFGYNAEKRGILLTDKFAIPDWKNLRHESLYYLELIKRVEETFDARPADAADVNPSLPVSEERRQNARNILEAAGIDLSRTTVAFGAGSTNSMAKRWGEKRFAELGDLLQNELNANVILLGAKDEVSVSQAVKEISLNLPVDLTGKTSLDEATAILSVIDLFISNDMGLAHIAGAVGTKTIVIFGPTNDETTRPLGGNVAIVRENVECSPCMLRECPIDHRCMTRILPRRVFEKAVEMLERSWLIDANRNNKTPGRIYRP